jgi:hypothetical protein
MGEEELAAYAHGAAQSSDEGYNQAVARAARKEIAKRAKRANDLTEYAVDGFNGAECRLLYSSAAWFAFQLGVYLKATGRSTPRDVRMGRGYSVRCADMLFKHVDGATFERVQ